MFYKYTVSIDFRNGKHLELHGSQCSTFTDPNGFTMILMFNNQIIIELTEGPGNVFVEGEVVHYNAAPRPALFDKFPPDWDPVNGKFNIIDKVVINSKGIEADSDISSAQTPADGSC